MLKCFFFFNDTATTEIYTLSLHDALPILQDHAYPSTTTTCSIGRRAADRGCQKFQTLKGQGYAGSWMRPSENLPSTDRKSTRLNSSHANISYAVFCLKKKNLIDTYTFYPY